MGSQWPKPPEDPRSGSGRGDPQVEQDFTLNSLAKVTGRSRGILIIAILDATVFSNPTYFFL